MEKQITLIIGLPGSGKSHLLKTEFNSPEYTVIDDPMKGSDIPEDFDNHLVIVDCRLCKEKTLESFYDFAHKRYGDIKINKIYFENSPEICFQNVAYRNDGRLVERTIIELSKIYTPSTNERIIPVFDTRKLKNKRKPFV